MSHFINILFFFFLLTISAQTAIQNNGVIQIHEQAAVGFHINLINNGTFNNNKGIAGFYSTDEVRTVSGTQKPVFFNVEIDALNNLELQTSLGLTNILSFINGKVITPRNDLSISLDFITHDFYAGEDNQRYVDGYVTVQGTNEFVFPIGDDERFRPMILPNQNTSKRYAGAYFYENPNAPNTFAESFLTDQKQLFIENISKTEFWDLNGVEQTSVTLTWDSQSNISSITNNMANLRVVGWHKTEKKWHDLGNSHVSGNFFSGQITSNNFVPDTYQVITIGSGVANGTLEDVNIIFTPNGDTTNETLVFEGLEQYNKNYLEIYNRWGNLVYKATNYKNDWKGNSTGRATIVEKDDLPVGTYFYILKFGNTNLSIKQKGWVYIQR